MDIAQLFIVWVNVMRERVSFQVAGALKRVQVAIQVVPYITKYELFLPLLSI